MDHQSDSRLVIEPCAHCKQEMDVSSLRPYSNAVCPTCGENTRVLDQMGVYKITGKIGVGGMSVVYRAEDTILGREVALKVLNETYGAQPERIAKFEDEARIMAKVQNEHMVKIYSVGREWECFYIAMELVDGCDLETFVREQGAIIEPQVLSIALQIVDGLDTAWQAGMLHRDIKPANILLDASGTAKIVDFGLSLLNTQKSMESEVWATPYYAPPETLLQQTEDCRSDMYALGCTLFQLLVGKPPFKEVPQSINDILEIKKNLPKLEKVAPEISPDTCRIINRLMEFTAAKRYPSYEELKNDLQNATANLDINSVDWQERRRTLIRRAARNKVKKISFIGGGTLLLGVVLVGAIIYWPDKEDKKAVSPVPSPPTQQVLIPELDKKEDIGTLFTMGQEALEKGDAPRARDFFNRILNVKDCPLSTFYWSGLQSLICSWIIGSNNEADVTLKLLHGSIAGMDMDKASAGVREVTSIIQYMEDSVNGVPDLADKSMGRIYFCVADSLKNWLSNNYEPLLVYTKELQEIRNTSKGSKESNMAQVWLKLMEPYIHDAEILNRISRMPQDTHENMIAKRDEIRQASDLQQSPGVSYRHMLTLSERSLNVASEDLKAKMEADKQDKGSDNQLDHQQAYNTSEALQKITNDLPGRWLFAETVEKIEEVKPHVNNMEMLVRLNIIAEMSQQADLLIKSLGNDVPMLPDSSRNVVLQGGTRVILDGLDTHHLLVENHPQGLKEIPLFQLGGETLIKLHRECTANIEKNPEMAKKRHSAAVSFLYLTGYKEQAKQAASVLLQNDLDFARDWKRWMLILDGEQ